jgi:hypothetical protein
MRFKILTLLSLTLLLFSSCKKNTNSAGNDSNLVHNEQEISEKDIKNLDFIEYALDQKVQIIIQDWTEYFQIQDVINNIKKGDLSFFNDNKKAINLLINALKTNIPEGIKSESIEARLLVVEIKLLKLESLANLTTTSKEKLLSTIEEFFISYSNLTLQMNKKIEFDSRLIEKP